MMENNAYDRSKLINITIFVEGSLLLVATYWSYHAQINLAKALVITPKNIGIGLIAGCLMAGFALLLLRLGKTFKPISQLRKITYDFLVPLVGNLTFFDLLAIAMISSFCEEVLFRGVVQEKLGLLLTSLIFGIFHDPTFQFFTYGLIAIFYGLVLGTLYKFTNNLWVPISAHFAHNLISLIVLRYFMKNPDPIDMGEADN